MIPLLAALSNWASTDDVTAGSFADFAFLKRVFKRVFASRFRSVRFSLWRTHLTAAFMLGTKGRLPRLRLGFNRRGYAGVTYLTKVRLGRYACPAVTGRRAMGAARRGSLTMTSNSGLLLRRREPRPYAPVVRRRIGQRARCRPGRGSALSVPVRCGERADRSDGVPQAHMVWALCG